VIAPFSTSEVVADAFELALTTRVLDIRASPYDLRGLGFKPIPIETRVGREESVARSQRARMLAEYQRLAS